MVKCCLVIKDGGKVNPSSEQEATTSPDIGELLEQMPPVLPISSQVMGEDRENKVSSGVSLASGVPVQVVVEVLEAEVANTGR